MYILRDTNEMREFLKRGIEDAQRQRGIVERIPDNKTTTGDRLTIAFHNGEITAYQHALELLNGLERGTSDSLVVRQLLDTED